MFSEADYLYFTDRALDGMADILRRLGDDLANVRPDLPGPTRPTRSSRTALEFSSSGPGIWWLGVPSNGTGRGSSPRPGR
jgi:hypothetical protein